MRGSARSRCDRAGQPQPDTSRVLARIGRPGIPAPSDNSVIGLPRWQLDLAAGGPIPYQLGASDLLVAAHDVEEFACGMAKIKTRQKRPQAKLSKEIAFQRLGLVQPQDVVR